ncbi:Cysteine desulfurase [Chlamydiales bacterium SCGC AG-110-M15]|nr:Cysteine desulfurase [Chlamydiales bacterium SCGC AG-110-M15]
MGNDLASQYRSDFPMLKAQVHGKPLIYLDSAASALKPQVVIDALVDFYENQYGTVHRAVYSLAAHSTEVYNQVRQKICDFIHASSSDEIIYTKGTTEAVNFVASTYGRQHLHKGDEILITQMEHHSNIVPWQMLCESVGAKLQVAPIDENGDLLIEEFHKLLSSKTKLVAVTHVSNVLGTINPIKQLTELAHNVGACVFVDGAQGIPHMEVDVQDLDVDFYAFSGHKAYGPTGVGVLYGKGAILNKMPPYQFGGAMVDKVTFEKTTFASPPARFEAGTPMIAEVVGLGATIDYILKVGLNNIEAYEGELLSYATHQLASIPSVRLFGTSKNKAAVLSFSVDGCHPLDLGTMLDFKGVALRTGHHCAQPLLAHYGQSSLLRASLAFYNSKQDIDIWIAAMKDAIEAL